MVYSICQRLHLIERVDWVKTV